ncbi:hypothetical protein PF438_04140 [Elizabethkingia meningoseptica]|uniref:hypothetical protein n=1 Tax=Elizabethkingia meningoseptica TaxID=238 RepID=UPI0022F1929E|nr:hypothetical protein [Elizabethkingia meningoseptica]EJK5330536.1 hypothetical protein [Elizabethkingia meningoseptica]WBS75682.1 hypothetical protein PF438_04140 [Elizabethkingia meningoseptica]
MIKPTLGVVPEYIWKYRRLEYLRKAIRGANHPVPCEWTDELNRLLVEIYGPVNKVSFTTTKIFPKKNLKHKHRGSTGPFFLRLEIDTSSIENFLKGVSFGIKLKK